MRIVYAFVFWSVQEGFDTSDYLIISTYVQYVIRQLRCLVRREARRPSTQRKFAAIIATLPLPSFLSLGSPTCETLEDRRGHSAFAKTHSSRDALAQQPIVRCNFFLRRRAPREMGPK